MLALNDRAQNLARAMESRAETLRIVSTSVANTKVLDCGVKALGGIEAGLGLARVCLADLAEVTLMPGDASTLDLPRIQVRTDQPVLACMASQYAGWQISVGK